MNFLKNCQKSLSGNQVFAFFSTISNTKVHFVNPSERVLSSESEDVFIVFLAQHVRELLPIITSVTTVVAAAGFKVLDSEKTERTVFTGILNYQKTC